MKHSPALKDLLTSLTQAVETQQFIKLTLSKPTAAAADLKSVDVRPIMVKRQLKLSFTYHYKTRDIVKNHSLDESTALISQLLAKSFTSARLGTLANDFIFTQHKTQPSLTRQPPSQSTPPCLEHDKPKQHMLQNSSKSYLHALGLTDANGEVLKSAHDKFRQINKYIETLDSLIKQLPTHKPLRIADMGSGKGYLTFALYDHLTNTLKLNVSVTGVEYRPDMVALCNSIAAQASFNQLHFVQGSIADYNCAGTDVVIALHACDTATDDALSKAIKAQASLIVVAPCCHKQIRKQMAIQTNHPLHFLLRYGTYTERMAEMITDGLRAQLLELHGYTPNLFEFISSAHTPKNVMIVATKSSKKPQTDTIQAAITAAKAQFGIQKHYLEELLNDAT